MGRKRKPGRPKGSKNKPGHKAGRPRKVGRPKGSTNKPHIAKLKADFIREFGKNPVGRPRKHGNFTAYHGIKKGSRISNNSPLLQSGTYKITKIG